MSHRIFTKQLEYYIDALFADIKKRGLEQVHFDYRLVTLEWLMCFRFKTWQYIIGYPEHAIDVRFYDQVRQLHRDMIHYFELIQ